MKSQVNFDSIRHQKVRYDGHLYVVIHEEFPGYRAGDDDYEIVIHPVCNELVVHITSSSVRKFLTVKKGNTQQVSSEIKS